MSDGTVTLNGMEWRIIVHALLAVSKSGGGSSQYHLFRKLSEQFGIEPDVSLLAHYQKIAHEEFIGEMPDNLLEQAFAALEEPPIHE